SRRPPEEPPRRDRAGEIARAAATRRSRAGGARRDSVVACPHRAARSSLPLQRRTGQTKSVVASAALWPARARAPRLHENAVTARGRRPPPHPPATRVPPSPARGAERAGRGGATRRVATAGA